MRNNVKKLIFILILLLAVGFAAVSTTLIINGTAKFGTNESNFDVYFSYAELDNVDKSDTIIATNGKSITFETKELSKVGDESILKFEVTNNSTQYDASIIMECKADGENAEYYTITNTIPSMISAKTVASGTVTATLKKVSTEAITENFTCTIEASAVERTEAGVGNEILGEVNTYSMYGYFTDENGEVIQNANLVVYSETPHYATTDEYGYFYVEGLEVGTHEIYYVGEVDATELTKEEVKKIAIDEINVTTSSKRIEFENGHKIVDSTIEKTNNETYEITFDTDGGSSISNKTVTKNSAYGELPEPTKTGYTFINWKTSDGKKVTGSSIVTKDSTHTLIAEYEINTYEVTINVTNGSISTNKIEMTYGSTSEFTTTATSGYYLESISCTNGYIVSGFTTGTSATGKQTITIDSNNNASNSVCTVSYTALCPYSAGKTWTYDYSGSSKTFTVPCAGTYKLEVYGAQGGTNRGTGGLGGYSYGNISLTKNTNLYVTVGGTTSTKTGGYNGGGTGLVLYMGIASGGGGATHIAKGSTNRGELKNYASYKSEVLIVAGGGGGGGYNNQDTTKTANGGAGGGTTGTVGSTSGNGSGTGGSAGTQSSGAAFGLGGNGSASQYSHSNGSVKYGAACGGGGGYFGGTGGVSKGGSGSTGGHIAGGAGGSGYIGGVIGGSTTAGQRSGNGYARITLVSLS